MAEKNDDRDNPVERLVYIGMVVDRFSMLESTLRRVTWLLLHADPVAAHVLTVQASANELITLSQRIIDESSRKGAPRGGPDLRNSLSAAKAVLERRNALLHNLHLPDEDFKMHIWRFRRGQDGPQIIPADSAALRALWEDANGVINRLMDAEPKPPFEMPPHYT